MLSKGWQARKYAVAHTSVNPQSYTLEHVCTRSFTTLGYWMSLPHECHLELLDLRLQALDLSRGLL